MSFNGLDAVSKTWKGNMSWKRNMSWNRNMNGNMKGDGYGIIA